MSEARNEICDQCGQPASVIRLIRTSGYNEGVTWRLALCAEHDEDLPGVALISGERCRQIAQEGWSADHDDAHSHGELAEAAAAYALVGKLIPEKSIIRTFRNVAVNSPRGIDDIEDRADVLDDYPLFPWDDEWWKPTGDPIRDLTKAGALIAAELDRLLRHSSFVIRHSSLRSP